MGVREDMIRMVRQLEPVEYRRVWAILTGVNDESETFGSAGNNDNRNQVDETQPFEHPMLGETLTEGHIRAAVPEAIAAWVIDDKPLTVATAYPYGEWRACCGGFGCGVYLPGLSRHRRYEWRNQGKTKADNKERQRRHRSG